MIPKEIIDKIYDNIYDLWYIEHNNIYNIVLNELIDYHDYIYTLDRLVSNKIMTFYIEDYKRKYININHKQYTEEDPYCGYCNYSYSVYDICICTDYCTSCRSWDNEHRGCLCIDDTYSNLGGVSRVIDDNGIEHIYKYYDDIYICSIKDTFKEEYINNRFKDK